MADDKLSQNDIDELLKAISSGKPEDIAPKAPIRNIKEYDFRTPSKFGKEHLRSLEMIFDSYARALSSFLTGYLRTSTAITVASAEQVIYKEFTNTLINPVVLAMIDFSPLKGTILMELSSHIGFSIIDRILGGPGLALKRMRDFSEIEIILLERVVSQTLNYLVGPWENVENLTPRLEKIETNSQFAQVIDPNETTALVTLEIKVGSVEGFINFVIPHKVIEPRMDRLNTRRWFMQNLATEEEDAEYGEQLEEQLQKANIPVRAIIGKTKITVGEFAGLQAGDIIQLDSYVDSDLIVTVGNLYKFKAKPGVSRGKNAVKITSLLDEEELHGG